MRKLEESSQCSGINNHQLNPLNTSGKGNRDNSNVRGKMCIFLLILFIPVPSAYINSISMNHGSHANLPILNIYIYPPLSNKRDCNNRNTQTMGNEYV